MLEKFNKSRSAIARRIRAKERLEARLAAERKTGESIPDKEGKKVYLALMAKDWQRAVKEIDILKSRI